MSDVCRARHALPQLRRAVAAPDELPGRYRCVYCLHRFELVSVCPDCGEHSTIVRMASTAIVIVQRLRRQHAEGDMTGGLTGSALAAASCAVDPRRRLRPPRARRCRRCSTPARA